MTLPEQEIISANVRAALAEDIGSGDLTADLVDPARRLRVQVISREAGVVAGRPWFDEVFRQLDPDIGIIWDVAEGGTTSPGSCLCRMTGPARPILTGERTALNFLQLLSGTATLTRSFVQAMSGTGTRVLDTRKTLPGLRQAQKYAVRAGGGTNHRLGLFDGILIKENHIAAAGGIRQVVDQARRLHPDHPVEVEAETLDQLEQAAGAGADRIMLDNFDLGMLTAAVREWGGRVELEASGGVDLDQAREIARTGVDFVSVGEITKRVSPMDLSLRYEED